MNFTKKRKIMGVSLIALISVTSLTGCAPFEALPEEERYFYIDKVLSDIDYQNIGEVTFEEKDNGDGVFAPSSKRVGYKSAETFKKIAEKLSNPENKNINHNCEYSKEIKNIDQYNCYYYGTVISMGKGPGGTSIMITDSSSGRKSK